MIDACFDEDLQLLEDGLSTVKGHDPSIPMVCEDEAEYGLSDETLCLLLGEE